MTLLASTTRTGTVVDDEFPDFDPRQHYALTLTSTEMTDTERNATRADDISLDP